MHDELYELPFADELRRCEQLTTPSCKARLSDGLFEVLDGSVVPAIEARELDLSRLDPRDSSLVRDVLTARLDESSDPVERVAALVMLDRATQLGAGALPSGAFRGLADKTVVEAQLLLMHAEHSVPQDADAIREVASLAAAAVADSRVQGAALNALARRNAPELISAVDALAAAHPAEWDGWSDVVVPALSRCGMACADQTTQVVAAAADPAAIVAQILRRCSPLERDDLLARIATALPVSVVEDARESAEL
jgi:hypothetical protein